MESLGIKKSKYLKLLMFASVFVCIFLLNYDYPYMADDYSLKLWGRSLSAGEKKFESLMDLLISSKNFYLYYGGRAPQFFIEKSLLQFPKMIYDVVNSVFFVLLLFGIYLNVNFYKKIEEKKQILVLSIILFLCWFNIPVFSETMIWKSGSGIYLTSMVWILYFVYFFKKESDVTEKTNYFKMSGYLILGLLAGCSVENISIAVLIGLIVWIFINRKYTKKQILLLVSFAIGAGILLFSPGSMLRLFTVKAFYRELYGDISLLLRLMIYLKFLLQAMLFSIILYSGLFIFIIYFLKKERRDTLKGIIKKYYFELLISILAAGSMIGTLYFPVRANLGAVVFLIIFMTNVSLGIINVKEIKKITVVLLLLTLGTYLYVLKDYTELRNQMVEREKIIKNSTDVIILPVFKYMPYHTMEMIETPNQSGRLESYYGKKIILFETLEQKNLSEKKVARKKYFYSILNNIMKTFK